MRAIHGPEGRQKEKKDQKTKLLYETKIGPIYGTTAQRSKQMFSLLYSVASNISPTS